MITRIRLRACTAVSVMAVLGLPAAAIAGTASSATDGVGDTQIEYTSGDGGGADVASVANDVTVFYRDGAYHFRDAGEAVGVKSPCQRVDDHEARCPLPAGDPGKASRTLTTVSVDLGAGDDHLVAESVLAPRGPRGELVLLFYAGGAGDDRLIGSDVYGTEFLSGGAGDDHLNARGTVDAGGIKGGGFGPPSGDFVGGGYGNDVLRGTAGDDSLSGGRGRDDMGCARGSADQSSENTAQDLVRPTCERVGRNFQNLLSTLPVRWAGRRAEFEANCPGPEFPGSRNAEECSVRVRIRRVSGAAPGDLIARGRAVLAPGTRGGAVRVIFRRGARRLLERRGRLPVVIDYSVDDRRLETYRTLLGRRSQP